MKSELCSLSLLVVAVFTLLTQPLSAQSSPIFWQLEEFQPRIPYGGRADTIAVNPSDNRVMFVASESGGLFKTADSGIHWSHVDALPAYYTSAVAYVTSDILLATTTDWFSVTNDGGGIWRSPDGGLTWSHIVNPAPPLPGVVWRFKANEISTAPDTGDIYVATSFGVSKSTDQGVTWNVETPFEGFEATSVAAQSGNLVIASTFDGRASTNVARSEDGGATWLPTTFPLPFGSNELHGLSSSPLDAKTFYAYGDPDFFVSEDSGATWSKIAKDFSRQPQDFCGGNGFVKAVAAAAGLTLWLGNRCHVAQLAAPQISGTSHFDYSGQVTLSTVDHWDSRDIAFDTHTLRTPILLATDGGVDRTSDGGRTWMLTGSGPNGYDALQIAEVKGQWISNAARYDLYIAVQDNNIWASGDAGLTWPSAVCCEGDFIEMQKHVSSPADSVVTANVCGNCTNMVGGAVFSKTYGAQFDGMQPWPNPPGPVIGHPTILSESFQDQGASFHLRFDELPTQGFAATHNLGSSWTQYAIVREDLRDIPKLSKIGVAPQNVVVPVQYQAIRTGFDGNQNFEIVHLVRLTTNPTNPNSAAANVYYPAMNGFGSIGIAPPWWNWYHVFAVDPMDSQHLIAPDISNGTIMESHDGGDNWSEIAGLTSLITDAGRFQPFGAFPFASHVSFSSDDPDSVAIGTQQNGLFVSRDRGATWSKVPASERATAITSVEWMSATEAFVSTLGRGLWKLTGNPHVRSVPQLCVVQSCVLRYIDKGDPAPDRFERGIIVFEGEIMGARMESGVVRELWVTPQTSVGFVGTPVKFSVRYTNKHLGLTGTEKTLAPPDGRLLTGLAVDKRGRLFGALYTSRRIPLSGKSHTRQDVKSATALSILQQNTSPTLSKPYISLSVAGKQTDDIEPGDLVTVLGERIARGTALEIILDGRPIQKAEPDGKGFLKTVVKAPKELGLHTLVVRDGNSKRAIDGTMFVIHHRDVNRE